MELLQWKKLGQELDVHRMCVQGMYGQEHSLKY